MTHDIEDIEDSELKRRVLFSVLTPAVQIADRFEIPLKELTSWLQLAYFKHLRGQRMSITEVGKALDVSERTAKTLSKKLRESFFLPERDHNLPLRIELMLWAQPMTIGRLKQVLDDVEDIDIDEALQLLVEQQRISVDDGKYTAIQSINPQVGASWVKQVGGLNNLIDNLSQVVLSRFFDKDDEAFARTLSFVIDEDRADVLEKAFAQIVEIIAAVDQEGQQAKRSKMIRMSLFWAPLVRKSPPEQK